MKRTPTPPEGIIPDGAPPVVERRRHRRVQVPAIVEAASEGGEPLGVWVIEDLSAGGAALLGDPLVPGQRLRLRLYLPGQPSLATSARVLRRQVGVRRGSCAVIFEPSTNEQITAFGQAIEEAERLATVGLPATVMIVHRSPPAVALLAQTLEALGHTPRTLESPFEAAAWLQRDAGATAVLVEDKLAHTHGWSFMQFVQECRPRAKRIIIATGATTFRTNFALRSGLIEAVVEEPFDGALLATRLGVGGRRRTGTHPQV